MVPADWVTVLADVTNCTVAPLAMFNVPLLARLLNIVVVFTLAVAPVAFVNAGLMFRGGEPDEPPLIVNVPSFANVAPGAALSEIDSVLSDDRVMTPRFTKALGRLSDSDPLVARA